MITALAHTCFVVHDLDASLQFYVDGLGLKLAFDFVHDTGVRYGVYLHVGGRNFIEMFQGETAARAEGQSYSHLCLEVDDIQATVASLTTRGIEVGPVKLGCDQSWQAWLADPDGNRIELHQYTPESWQAPHVR
jgi:lactoylglutathione lyase/glyoxylase I family protein